MRVNYLSVTFFWGILLGEANIFPKQVGYSHQIRDIKQENQSQKLKEWKQIQRRTQSPQNKATKTLIQKASKKGWKLRKCRNSWPDLGRFPFGQKFRKFRFGAKWKTFFRFARRENSQKKWNYRDDLLSSSTFSGNFPAGRTEKTFSI